MKLIKIILSDVPKIISENDKTVNGGVRPYLQISIDSNIKYDSLKNDNRVPSFYDSDIAIWFDVDLIVLIK